MTSPNPQADWLGVKDVALLLSVSPTTARCRLAAMEVAGTLKHIGSGSGKRFKRADVDRALEASKHVG